MDNEPKTLLDRMPGWPSERAMIIFMTWSLGAGMLVMAETDPTLWNQELYKTLLTLILGTGFINMILAGTFTSNANDAKRVDNTSKALDAITATANAAGVPDPGRKTKPDLTLEPGHTAVIEGQEHHDQNLGSQE